MYFISLNLTSFEPFYLYQKKALIKVIMMALSHLGTIIQGVEAFQFDSFLY